MKFVALTSAALLAATTAFAGNLNFEAPAEETIVEEVTSGGSLGGSGAWIIPLVAVAAIAFAISANNNDE